MVIISGRVGVERFLFSSFFFWVIFGIYYNTILKFKEKKKRVRGGRQTETGRKREGRKAGERQGGRGPPQSSLGKHAAGAAVRGLGRTQGVLGAPARHIRRSTEGPRRFPWSLGLPQAPAGPPKGLPSPRLRGSSSSISVLTAAASPSPPRPCQ